MVPTRIQQFSFGFHAGRKNERPALAARRSMDHAATAGTATGRRFGGIRFGRTDSKSRSSTSSSTIRRTLFGGIGHRPGNVQSGKDLQVLVIEIGPRAVHVRLAGLRRTMTTTRPTMSGGYPGLGGGCWGFVQAIKDRGNLSGW
jgi:hypothetical protein